MNKQAKQPSIKWVLNRHSSVPVFEGAPTPNHSITRFDLTQKGEVVETKPWDNYIKTDLKKGSEYWRLKYWVKGKPLRPVVIKKKFKRQKDAEKWALKILRDQGSHLASAERVVERYAKSVRSRWDLTSPKDIFKSKPRTAKLDRWIKEEVQSKKVAPKDVYLAMADGIHVWANNEIDLHDGKMETEYGTVLDPKTLKMSSRDKSSLAADAVSRYREPFKSLSVEPPLKALTPEIYEWFKAAYASSWSGKVAQRVAKRYAAKVTPDALLVYGEIDSDASALKVTVSGVGPMNTPKRPLVTSFSVNPWERNDLEKLLTQNLRRSSWVTAENHFFVFALDDVYNHESEEFGWGSDGLKKFNRYMKRNFGSGV
jgi:hypothetical protein